MHEQEVCLEMYISIISRERECLKIARLGVRDLASYTHPFRINPG